MERSEFIEEVNKWAKKIGVEPKEIQIRSMKRKWGSCSSKGRVTFNAELLNQALEIRYGEFLMFSSMNFLTLMSRLNIFSLSVWLLFIILSMVLLSIL